MDSSHFPPTNHISPLSDSRFSNLVLLKLGGSLITDKQQPYTLRPQMLRQVAQEIADACHQNPSLQLILGHGAGSFAHTPAKKYGTRAGVYTPEQWQGFAEVWWEAATLNRYVMEALHREKLPAIALPPSASIMAQDGKMASWDLNPIKAALCRGLLPVIFGDVIFDSVRGGTIFSTEDLFDHLARNLRPQRILLAGIESGVWADYPLCQQLLSEITPASFDAIQRAVSGSSATDVTGGMASKVAQSLALVQSLPELQVLIFSGEKAGNVANALAGEKFGTCLKR
ncbi:MAG: isopentenyl phosphate kinase family protein [Anaerolineales bacterium]|nr:isopentenyl phosphate kinase family protein [Anaerolineales bacterium]